MRGVQAFSAGKHYWELDVDHSMDWALGVCKDSFIRNKGTLLESKDVFLLLSVKEDNGCTLFTTSPIILHYVEKPLGRIGVLIDCESGSEKLVMKMRSIWDKIQENKRNLKEESTTINHWMEYVALRKVVINIQYQKMHQFLHDEEQRHLQALEREAQEIFQELRDSEVRMAQQKERMKDMYRELTEMCHKPDVELLQVRGEGPDLGNILESVTDAILCRTQSVQAQKPQPVNPELTSLRITGLLDMLNTFRGERQLFGSQILLKMQKKIHILLIDDVGRVREEYSVDNLPIMEMASCYISLSENLRSVIFGDEDHRAPWELEATQSFAACGAEAFATGRHYWELDVTHYSSWVLGVCKDSQTQDNSMIIDCEDAVLLFSLKGIKGYRLSTSSPPLVQCVQRPLSRVGVFLDYDNRTVSFYDVSKAALIYSLLISSFSSPLRPFLYLCSS
nr:putative tripartite motif-containing protein 64B [Microcebus murinus]